MKTAGAGASCRGGIVGGYWEERTGGTGNGQTKGEFDLIEGLERDEGPVHVVLCRSANRASLKKNKREVDTYHLLMGC